MSRRRVVLVTSRGIVDQILPMLRALPVDLEVAFDLGALRRAVEVSGNASPVLLSVNSGVLVPGDVLERVQGAAYNFHAAPPEFPGRDPHHFAVYRRARRFGATAHVMTESVDAGPIVDVEYVDVPDAERVTAQEMYGLGRKAILALFGRNVERMVTACEPLPPLPGVAWGPEKTTRKMFRAMCEISPDMDREELELRIRAFGMPGHRNLRTTIQGHAFYLAED